MNLVSLLIAPAVVQLTAPADANHAVRIGIAILAAAVAGGAIILSRVRAGREDIGRDRNGSRQEAAAH